MLGNHGSPMDFTTHFIESARLWETSIRGKPVTHPSAWVNTQGLQLPTIQAALRHTHTASLPQPHTHTVCPSCQFGSHQQVHWESCHLWLPELADRQPPVSGSAVVSPTSPTPPLSCASTPLALDPTSQHMLPMAQLVGAVFCAQIIDLIPAWATHTE